MLDALTHEAPSVMSPSRSETIQARVVDQLSPHGSEGARAALTHVIDLEALEHGRYHEVLETVNARLSRARYSLISMLVAGIYFGLLVGFWLMDFSSWMVILQWSIPAVLVTIYGVYASYQTIVQIRQLSEARALLHLLLEPSPRDP